MIVFIYKWLKKAGFFAGMLAVAPAAPTSMALLLIMAGSAPTFYLISAEYINRYAGFVRKPTVSWFLSASQDHNDYLYQDRLGTNIGKALKKRTLAV
jgi:hypothetical protein